MRIGLIGSAGVGSRKLFETRLPLRRFSRERFHTAHQFRKMNVVIYVAA